MAGCSPPSKTTDTYSNSLPDLYAREKFLKQYFHLPGEVEDLVFHVVYQDNSGGMIPGPSDWDIKILARITTKDLSNWQGALQPWSPGEKPDISWIEELSSDWVPDNARPNHYGTPSDYLVVYPESQLVARRISTL